MGYDLLSISRPAYLDQLLDHRFEPRQLVIVLRSAVLLLQPGPLISVVRRLCNRKWTNEFEKHRLIAKSYQTHSHDLASKVYQVVDSVLLGDAQSSVLEKSLSIFIWYAISEEDIQCNDPDFVLVAVQWKE